MPAQLIDTQILIWLSESPEKISAVAFAGIELFQPTFFQLCFCLGIGYKNKNRKLSLQFSLEEFMKKAIEKHSLLQLPISLSHIYTTLQLPLHHNDPFDRLIMAQALAENMPVISSDAKFDAYPVTRIW